MGTRVLVISHMYPNQVNPMAGIFVHNQTKALKRAGVDVRVVVPVPYFPLYRKWQGYRQLPAHTELDGIPVHYVPTWMFPGGFFFSRYGTLYVNALRKVLPSIYREFPFELIHCHTIYPDGYAGSLLKQTFAVPVVSTVHGSDIMLYPKRNRKVHERTEQALRGNDFVIAVSERARQEVDRMTAGVSTATVYNGFDPTRFKPMEKQAAREKLGLPPAGKNVLFVGNLYQVKGIPYLLESFKTIASESEEVHLYLIGEGPLRSELVQQAEQLGLGNRVTFLGRKPYEEIPVWINSADVVALTSLSEGLPSILLETMGCGRAMVATDVGGIREILQDGRTGLLAESQNVAEITKALRKILLENESFIDTMGKQALEASRKLTWEQNAENIKAVYAQVLKRHEG
ncbi:glycosyltransferase family 4 protein [Laceyella putida]|uniref:Glycosyltransferase family 4 protein n=1 Tax=Laceyella putida TaxID=110101 RepID=A0ABW2RGG2_9BACL